MSKILTYIIIFVTFFSIGFAQSGKMTSAFEFLNNESSSRAAALGGSFVSFTGDPNIIFYNPAGLASCDGKLVSFGFLKHLLDVNGGYASYAQHLETLDGWVGGGIQYINYGSFDQTDELGNNLGEFSAGDLALSLGYARKTEDNLSYGVNLKLIYSSIAANTSMGLAGDFGILYTIPDQMLNIGASVLTLGKQIKTYGGIDEDLPLDIIVGVSKTLEHLPLNLSFNLHKLNLSYDNFFERFKTFTLGGEFTLSKYVKFRAGYDNEKRIDLKLGSSSGFGAFSLGLGIVINKYSFDYAFSSYGKIGALHRINLSTSL